MELPATTETMPIPFPDEKYISPFRPDLLKGRTALVTGGTRGIGFATAKALLAAGGNVVITGRNIDVVNRRIDDLAQSCISAEATRIGGISLEMKDVASFREKWAEANALPCCGTHGIDILVNNAGILNFARFGSTFPEDFDDVMQTNLRGAYFLSQCASEDWITRGENGKKRNRNILVVCSSSSLRPANSPYNLAKWALRGLVPGMAKTLAPFGIVVNGIAPGPTATDAFLGANNKGSLARPRMPGGRLIAESEVANLAVVLVSPLGRMVLGSILYVTAGCGNLTQDDCRFTFGNS